MKLAKLLADNTLEMMPIPYNDWYEGLPYSNLHLIFLSNVAEANRYGWSELQESEPDMREGYYYTPRYRAEGNVIIEEYDEHILTVDDDTLKLA